MESLKEMYNRNSIEGFAQHLKNSINPIIDVGLFKKQVFGPSWEALELKQRVYHLADVLQLYLNKDVKEAISQLEYWSSYLSNYYPAQNFICIFIPHFIAKNGLDYPHESINAMAEITKLTSCEFAIRPFIEKHQKLCLDKMLEWSKNENPYVRRLSSEGCRPRLPWGMALKALKENPKPIIPILENLKNDRSEYVRKSVANNLNDISKDNPHFVLELIKQWKGKNKHTDWICKHGARTLLKEANPAALSLFGYEGGKFISTKNIELKSSTVYFGEDLQFSFQVDNQSDKAILLRIEYAIYYQKANGKLSKKVYKISERELPAKQSLHIKRKQPFKPISTRKFYSGNHQLSIIINGQESTSLGFILKKGA